MGDDLYVDPQRRYVMPRPTEADRALRLWTGERLRFHTSLSAVAAEVLTCAGRAVIVPSLLASSWAGGMRQRRGAA
jgi:hypothetical protein